MVHARERERYAQFMKDMDTDVNCIKAMLIEKVGADWQSVCQRSTWQNSQPPVPQLINARDVQPWDHVRDTMSRRGDDSVSVFIARRVRNLTSNYYSWRP